jgi:hypothetical protein
MVGVAAGLAVLGTNSYLLLVFGVVGVGVGFEDGAGQDGAVETGLLSSVPHP